MITVTCHCQNVSISFAQLPGFVRDCDCPMCNRLGALWGDFMTSDVLISSQTPTMTYLWGEGEFEMHHCSTCGCSTHYTSIDQLTKGEIGINLRMLSRKDLELIPVQTG